MEASKAISFTRSMWLMWIGPAVPYPLCTKENYDKIRASITHDLSYRRNKPIFAGVVTEMRGQLSKLGMARKAMGQ